jgi:hypothetical protein
VSSQDLGDRYGAPAPWRRRALVVASAALGVVFLVWLAWTAWAHATPDVESSLVGYEVVDEHTATARVQVRLADEDVEASCLVRAYAEDHTTVGELAFTPEYGADQPIEVTVRTERRATSVERVGCTTPGEPRPR